MQNVIFIFEILLKKIFYQDLERNDGSVEKPFYMATSLREGSF